MNDFTGLWQAIADVVREQIETTTIIGKLTIIPIVIIWCIAAHIVLTSLVFANWIFRTAANILYK